MERTGITTALGQKASLTKRILLRVLLAVLATAALAGLLLLFVRVREDMETRRAASIREAVEAAALQCYVVEGVYPDTLAYLEQHYGVMVDHSRYIVSYECVASNRSPKVMVLKK